MSNKIVNSKESKREFLAIEKIHEPYNINTINQEPEEFDQNEQYRSKKENVEFLNKISDMLENNHLTGFQKSEPTATNIATFFEEFFERRENDTFEWYQRAGKLFFRCDHTHDKNYSEMIKNAFESIIEEKMQKKGTHYIITPNSTCAVFR